MGHLHYQFDPNSNGDVYSSPDKRDPQELKRIYEHQEKHRTAVQERSREIADEIMRLSKSAPLHDISGEQCPVLVICDEVWGKYALLGEKCFPLKRKGGKYLLELHNSMGATNQEIDLCKVIKRYVNNSDFSYRFL